MPPRSASGTSRLAPGASTVIVPAVPGTSAGISARPSRVTTTPSKRSSPSPSRTTTRAQESGFLAPPAARSVPSTSRNASPADFGSTRTAGGAAGSVVATTVASAKGTNALGSDAPGDAPSNHPKATAVPRPGSRPPAMRKAPFSSVVARAPPAATVTPARPCPSTSTTRPATKPAGGFASAGASAGGTAGAG